MTHILFIKRDKLAEEQLQAALHELRLQNLFMNGDNPVYSHLFTHPDAWVDLGSTPFPAQCNLPALLQQEALGASVVFLSERETPLASFLKEKGYPCIVEPIAARHLTSRLVSLHDASTLKEEPRVRSRILFKRGLEHVLMPIEQVVLFFSENKVTYVLDHNGKKFLTDKTLAEWEQSLDPQLFFRANRQYILHSEYVAGFKPHLTVKLLVTFRQDIAHKVIISQETAPRFRQWISQL